MNKIDELVEKYARAHDENVRLHKENLAYTQQIEKLESEKNDILQYVKQIHEIENKLKSCELEKKMKEQDTLNMQEKLKAKENETAKMIEALEKEKALNSELEKKIQVLETQNKSLDKFDKVYEMLTVVVETTHQVDDKETYEEQADFLFEQIQKIKKIIDRWYAHEM